jgi:hypothetical protein
MWNSNKAIVRRASDLDKALCTAVLKRLLPVAEDFEQRVAGGEVQGPLEVLSEERRLRL